MEKFKPVKSEKDIISIRISKDFLNEIDRIATENELSRNEFILQSIRFALNNMDDSSK